MWEWAEQTLKSRLDLKEYPVPLEFRSQKALIGKPPKEQRVVTTTQAFSCRKIRQLRAVQVEGGASLQVLNLVIFPDLKYDLPFFGADFVTLPGGHLIALDLQPLFQTPEYQIRYSTPLLPTTNRYKQTLPWGGDLPEEATQFFSPALIWSRPKERETVSVDVFAAFREYLQHYLQMLEDAEEVTDCEQLALIKEKHLAYSRYRSEKDPARGMLTRFYGAEWTERVIHELLFDLPYTLGLD